MSFSFLFLIIDSYFLIPAAIAQIFNLNAELVTATGTPIKEAYPEIQTQPLTAEMKTRICPKYFKALQIFAWFSLIK